MAELNEVEVPATLQLEVEQVERFIAALDAFGELGRSLSKVAAAFEALSEAIPDVEVGGD